MIHTTSPTNFTFFFFFNDTATTEIYTLPLHDALPICPSTHSAIRPRSSSIGRGPSHSRRARAICHRSEEHTSELQSPCNLVCRLLLEKKKHTAQSSSCIHHDASRPHPTVISDCRSARP